MAQPQKDKNDKTNNIMRHLKPLLPSVAAAAFALSFAACSDDNKEDFTGPEAQYVGQAVGNFTADEWYPGGKLGTTENISSNCYSDESPATESMGLMNEFFTGEQLFEKQFSPTQLPFKGLGPASVRRSCIDCHPNYGHGQRHGSYTTQYDNGNGYLLVVYHPTDGLNSDDGPYISEVTGMPQTQAVSPFLPPIDESRIELSWHKVEAMESGLPLAFPDGEKYELIYPELNIPVEAFNTSPKPTNLAFRLESTIGIGGTGLLDAIPEEAIKEQYARTAAYYASQGLDVSEYVNPNFWDAGANDFASGAWYAMNPGKMADGQQGVSKMIKRFTYALTRASLQDGAGANAIWNITNVSRPDRPKLYTTSAWAQAMAENQEVISRIMADPTSPYYAPTEEETRDKVRNLLDPQTDQFDNKWHNFTPEMTSDQFHALMVWHRGLAIPRARNLNDPTVQRGKEVFMEIGCASCHRPSWKTGDDNYWTPDCIADKPLPRYQNQTIYPYSDMMQHKLYMKNGIHGSWCRTTPLWGRGLSLINTGAEDRLHDCRARNEIEAIMWHAYSKKSHAYESTVKFYNLTKADRDAVVKFLRSI